MPNLLHLDDDGNPIYDFSDEIAHLQCQIIMLLYFAPEGDWLRLPLYQQWKDREARLSMKYRDLLELSSLLTVEIVAYSASAK